MNDVRWGRLIAAGRFATPSLHRALPRSSASASPPNLTAAVRFAAPSIFGGASARLGLAALS